jgi:hypothetical protein
MMSQASSTSEWYRVTIPVAECETKAQILQNDFETLFTINDTPNGAALFTSRDENAENQHFYFSPGAVVIALGLIQHFSGQHCEAPVAQAQSLKLLVGRAEERDVLLKKADKQPSDRKIKLSRLLSRDVDDS